MGTVAVRDQCTTVGPNLTNPILTLSPGALTTWRPAPYGVDNDDSLHNFVGDVWSPQEAEFELLGSFDVQYTAPLDVKDLACPIWGLGTSTAANGTIFTTVGPPWLPLIQPPMDIFSLNPTWAAICTGIFSDFIAMSTLDLFDPPVALTPASMLLLNTFPRPMPKPAPAPADPTTRSVQASPSANAAKPAPIPHNPSAPPAATSDPRKGGPQHSPTVASADPAGSAPLPDGLADSPDKKGDPASDSPSDPLSDPGVASVAGDQLADPKGSSFGASDRRPNNVQNSPAVPKEPAVLVTQGADHPSQTQGIGAIIFNAFGRLGPDGDGIKSAANTPFLPPQSIITINDQTFTANPTGFKVNNAALAPGGTAYTVNDTIISLGRSGVLVVGSSTISLTAPATASVLAVADQTFTPNPSAFSIAGTIISAGGPAVTVGGTPISLQPSGTLLIGSSTIQLLTTPQTTSSLPDIDTYGVVIQAESSSFVVVDGVTLSAGAMGVTVSGGKVVSLETNEATLDIGTSRFALPTPTGAVANGSINNVQAFTGGGQGGERRASIVFIISSCLQCLRDFFDGVDEMKVGFFSCTSKIISGCELYSLRMRKSSFKSSHRS